jgi:hypothetical protein
MNIWMLARALIVRCLGALVVGVSGTALLGYLLHQKDLHTWPGSVAMAAPTSVCFLCTGVAIILLSFRK